VKAAWSVAKAVTRVPGVTAAWRADVTWLERELVAGTQTLEPLLKQPYAFDLDDAIWLVHPRRERSLGAVVGRAGVVLAGNQFLGDWASRWNEHVDLVPTAVDTTRFCPGPTRADRRRADRRRADDHRADPRRAVTIGWIGTSSNFRYLAQVEEALGRCLSEGDAELLVVADRRPPLTGLPPERVRYRRWGAEDEVDAIREMDIGIMPLAEDDWCRGKCALKMLQYMACGIPVVVSPLPLPAHILSLDDGAGIGATTTDDWGEALRTYVRDPELRASAGSAGRGVVVGHYDTRLVAPQIAAAFHRLVR
jgi:glycosyltransferase involved in cell wall biosynthesis